MTIEAGTPVKSDNEYIEELQTLLGAEPPIGISVNALGELQTISVEETWKEGGTTPIEEEYEVEKVVVNEDGEEETVTVTETRVVDYEEDYTQKKLTQKQISDLNAYIQDNIEQ